MSSGKMNKVLLGSATVMALGAAAGGAQAATTAVPIQAIILAPVQITQNQSLNFGELTETGAGTAAVDNAGAITTSASITSIGGTIQQGLFTLKGSTGRNIEVTAPNSVSITHTTAGANKMTVNAFTVNGSPAVAATPFVTALGATAVTGFDLGATLNIGAGQVTGTYKGSVTLTAVYQ